MWQALVFGFLAGLMGGNIVPHLFKGIVREEYPNLLGNGPVPNFVAGWVGLLLTALFAYWAHGGEQPFAAVAAAALGLLLIGVFHARGGAFALNQAAGRANP